MHRRDFLARLGTGAAAGLAAQIIPFSPVARAAGGGPQRMWLHLAANGGWCPLSCFDPHPSPARNYGANDIETFGAFRVAPFLVPTSAKIPDPSTGAVDPSGFFHRFFSRYQKRLLLINGVDNGTGDHPTAANFAASGGLALPYPAFAALCTAAKAPSLPMAYCGDGTANVIGASNADMATLRANAKPLLRMASPNLVVPDGSQGTYQDDASYRQILEAVNDRLTRLQAEERVPFRAQQRTLVQVARGATDNQALINMLNGLFGAPVNLNELGAQVDVLMACFQAGLAMGAKVNIPGGQLYGEFAEFDTHGDHDRRAYPLTDAVLRTIDYAVQRADAASVPLNVMVTSDFGRTPGYNSAGGTDHNPSACSYMFIGPDFPGGRVIGKTEITDYGVQGMKLDPVTLQPRPDGVALSASHIHAALRQLAGIDNSPVAQSFPIASQVLPLFSAPT